MACKEGRPMVRGMTIGEAASAIGVSAKAIRLWEARGLMPGIERTPAGYRLFGEDDLALLRFIRQARALGMSLGEIGDVLDLRRAGTAPCARVTQMLDERIREIDRALAALERLREALLAARERADEAPREATDGPMLCRIIEQVPECDRQARDPMCSCTTARQP